MTHEENRPMPVAWRAQSFIHRRHHHRAKANAKGVLEIWKDDPGSARYQAELPIVALVFRDNHRAAVMIQAKEMFEIVGPAEDERFVTVRLRAEECLVFASDVQDRGTLVEAPVATAVPA